MDTNQFRENYYLLKKKIDRNKKKRYGIGFIWVIIAILFFSYDTSLPFYLISAFYLIFVIPGTGIPLALLDRQNIILIEKIEIRA